MYRQQVMLTSIKKKRIKMCPIITKQQADSIVHIMKHKNDR
jgi:hypothetical protein